MASAAASVQVEDDSDALVTLAIAAKELVR